MKRFVITCLAVTALTLPALSATGSKAKAKAKGTSAKKSAVTAAPTPAPAAAATAASAEAAAMTTSAASTVGAPTAGASTASLSEVAKPAGRKIKGEFYNYSSVKVTNVKNNTGAVAASNWLGVRYVVSDKYTISVRPTFSFTYPKGDEDLKVHMGDTFIQNAFSEFAKVGDVSMDFYGRVYFPTGETSRYVTKTNGSLLGWFIATKPLSKDFNLYFHSVASWYNQTVDGVADAATGEVSPNPNIALSNWFELEYQFAKKFAFTVTGGMDHTYYRQAAGSTLPHSQEQAASLGSYFTITAVPKVAFLLGIENSIDTYRPKQNFRPFRDDQSKYYLVTQATF